MKRLFAIIDLVMGIWLFISPWALDQQKLDDLMTGRLFTSPWVLDYSGALAQWSDCVVGLVIVALSLYVLLLKTESPTSNWPFLIKSVLGAGLIISGVFVFGQVSVANRWNDIILGILVAFFSLFAIQITEGIKSFTYTKEGGILLEMQNILYKDGNIVIKGKTFGTMPVLMHVRPADIWNMLGLLPLSTIARLPGMLIVGWRKSKEASKVVKNCK